MRPIHFFTVATMAVVPLIFTGCGDVGTNPNYNGRADMALEGSGYDTSATGNNPSSATRFALRGPVKEAPGSPVFENAPAGNLTGGGTLRSDFEDQDAGCWGNRQASGYSTKACGDWDAIGSLGARLAQGEVSHSGTKSMAVTFKKNEEVAGASLPINADVVSVRSYYNFAEGFDFGQGIKIGRLSSFNETTHANDIDMVLEVRSAGGQCGLTDMADVGVFFNGRPVGHDWGSISTGISFQRGRWYAIEYQVSLNTPGAADGWVKLWVDGVLVGSKTGINIRGEGGASTKLNRLRVGGWYSNGARGNGCVDPSGASTMYVDDVAVGKDAIGLN